MEGSEEVPTLKSQQEGADGRLLLHASHAVHEGFNSVLICSEDTDIFIMSLAFSNEIGAFLFTKCETRMGIKVVHITNVAASLGPAVCKGVFGMHAFTEGHTVSAFAGKGKAQELKILKKNKKGQEALTELEKDWDLPPELTDKLEELTCLLYCNNTVITKDNELRYQLFCSRRREIKKTPAFSMQRLSCEPRHESKLSCCHMETVFRERPISSDSCWRRWKIEHEDGVTKLVVDWMGVKAAPKAIQQQQQLY